MMENKTGAIVEEVRPIIEAAANARIREKVDRKARGEVSLTLTYPLALPLRPLEVTPQAVWAKGNTGRFDDASWDEFVWACHDAFPDFPGDIIRFWETAFEGLTLADGTQVWA